MQTLRWAATALAAVLAATTAQAQETIKIGMTQPLTGAGGGLGQLRRQRCQDRG